MITYQDATWKNGTVSDYGSVKVKTKPYDASVTSWSTRAVLGSVMNNESGARLMIRCSPRDYSRWMAPIGWCVIRRWTGSYVSGKPVTSNTSTSFTARNVKIGWNYNRFHSVWLSVPLDLAADAGSLWGQPFLLPRQHPATRPKGWLFQFFKT